MENWKLLGSQGEYPSYLKTHKKHIPNNILNCKAPMVVEAPKNLRELDKHAQGRGTQRVAWMSCAFLNGLHEMVFAYKSKFCKPGFNFAKTEPLGIRDRPSDVWGSPVDGGAEEASDEGLIG